MLVEEVAAEQFHPAELSGGGFVFSHLLVAVGESDKHLARHVHIQAVALGLCCLFGFFLSLESLRVGVVFLGQGF